MLFNRGVSQFSYWLGQLIIIQMMYDSPHFCLAPREHWSGWSVAGEEMDGLPRRVIVGVAAGSYYFGRE
ncbi:MAG: hypothetical protein ACQESR_30040 [Planctomycetota bacterium]